MSKPDARRKITANKNSHKAEGSFFPAMKMKLFRKKRTPASRNDLDMIRSRIDTPPDLLDAFQVDKTSEDYKSVYSKTDPLVSICVGTYNRGDLLVERCLKSLINQSYKNLQIIVVGDCCTDDTEKLVAGIKDSRVSFENLSRRGDYPLDPNFKWMVAGTDPVNRGLELSEGDFISHLDDDDEHMPERVEKLVEFIQTLRAELVWHPFLFEQEYGKWKLNSCNKFDKGRITTSSVLYHRWFKRLPWDINAYRFHEPGDWNRFRKFSYLGANVARYPDVLLRHYRERNQRN
jgi:glycosyltransferase involved in cell wall biosynthesis